MLFVQQKLSHLLPLPCLLHQHQAASPTDLVVVGIRRHTPVNWCNVGGKRLQDVTKFCFLDKTTTTASETFHQWNSQIMASSETEINTEQEAKVILQRLHQMTPAQ